MRRGKRESTGLLFRRCLAIIQRLQRGPASRHELIEAVLANEPEAYGSGESARIKRFRRDVALIRNALDIEIKANPRTRLYAIVNLERPLLDLPDTALKAMAWLEQTFGPATPHQAEIQNFVQQLRFYLSPERRQELDRQRTELVLELGQQDDDRLDPDVELKLHAALARRLRVEFDYFSPQYTDGQPRCHRVDIFEPPRFEPALGHYYVRGWCHRIDGPEGRLEVGNYIPYRFGRIKNLRLMTNKLPPAPPKAKRFAVKYWLSAAIARYGVTRRRWIDFDAVERQDDESYIVTGATDSTFFALLELMHYRDNCRVLGGPELLKEMRETVKKMADLYQIEG